MGGTLSEPMPWPYCQGAYHLLSISFCMQGWTKVFSYGEGTKNSKLVLWYPYLWHPLGHRTSEAGVQQGDPLVSLIFALVLHKAIVTIDADDECLRLILQAWYLDDGVLVGPKQTVLRALSIIENLAPSLGI